MYRGWIKLHRKSLESAAFRDPALWQMWTYCLMMATHKEMSIIFAGEQRVLMPGEFVTGRNKLHADLEVPRSTAWGRIKKLEIMRQIRVESDNKRSVVSIVNWDAYQQIDGDYHGEADNKPTTSRQPADNQPTTSRQPADTNNNVNNVKTAENAEKSTPPADSGAVANFVLEWNAMASGCGLPCIRRELGVKRSRALAQRLRDAGWRSDYREAIDKIPASQFLTGKLAGTWQASAGWFLQSESVRKIMEGNYDGKASGRDTGRNFETDRDTGGKFGGR